MEKTLTRAALAAALMLPLAAAGHTPAPLMPHPQSLIPTGEHWQPQAASAVRFSDHRSTRLKNAAERALTELPEGTHLTLSVGHPAVADADWTPQPAREAYRLAIDTEGVTLSADYPTGALRGLQTLRQWAAACEGTLATVTIEDQPRFGWRGVLIDSVRHFLPLETLKRQIDGMASAKLNVFHWHLTDDQGWRLESPAYPELHRTAPGGDYYTREQVKELVAYARERGVRVLPEIDMPGHASAIAVAYPELMSAPGPYQPETRWGVHKPLLNPANEKVYEFARTILTEVSELFPFPYVHIGGDEVDPEHWQQNPEIQAFMATHNLPDSAALHSYFNHRLATILDGLDRHMIGWDEVLHKDLPGDTVVQSWRGPDALGQAINQGHPALLSTGFYLDQPQPAAYHYRVRLLPEPVGVDTTVAEGERFETWSFTLPRKRGSAVTGRLTLIESTTGERRGFIDFAGKSRQAVNNLRLESGELRFWVDTWMGETSARLILDGDQLGGEVIVGNAPYPASGEHIAGSAIPGTSVPEPFVAKTRVAPQDQPLLLGGEAALWAELVDPNTIDVRLWPRAFAVAERLWSGAERRDLTDMYARLDAVSDWAADTVGLQHNAQQRQLLQKRLGEGESLEQALTVSSAAEPAQYYHRHHEKSVNETYSRADRLDRFVDSLPAESRTVQRFARRVEAWLANQHDKVREDALRAQLRQWREAGKALADARDPELAAVAANLHAVAGAGLTLIEHINHQRPLSADERERISRALDTATNIQHEVIVAAGYPIERLVEYTQPPRN